ncbi:uncharacterized protein CC84DRAFT_518584 [Paraphaeosphaeria sporulosa]|uniref:Uncharacterized protein n=1 Tax=Paraphaeosphaeria sporulosa TaxID=1460663 RepID=A0A177CU64_9PLEO|nr:uncharacterized protein CC84DRAFT_518584 [Paraphaeosphaeria sporulosa]OAG11074.1 hypothetical protein CC84DRAFT_518584 [Paraphaeosphaeria sporulosa]
MTLTAACTIDCACLDVWLSKMVRKDIVSVKDFRPHGYRLQAGCATAAARTEFSRDPKTTGVPSPNLATPLPTRQGPCSARTSPCSTISISVHALLRRLSTDGGNSGVCISSSGLLIFFYRLVISLRPPLVLRGQAPQPHTTRPPQPPPRLDRRPLRT